MSNISMVFTQMHGCLVQNRQKVKVNPFTHFLGLFSKSIFSRINRPMKLKSCTKRFLRPKVAVFSTYNKSQNWSKIVKK